MRITRMNEKNCVTIPSCMVEKFRLKKGDLFHVEVEENFIKLLPVKVEQRELIEFEHRSKEPTVSHQALLKKLKAGGKI